MGSKESTRTDKMLTDEQKTHFHLLGFLKIPGVLTHEEIDDFSTRFDAVMDKAQDDDSVPGHRIFPDGHRVIVPLFEADPFFYNLLDHPKLSAIAEDLLGEDCIFYGSSDGQIHSGNTNWHRDGNMPEPAIDIKQTFYLDEIAQGKGCLSFIPGSHHWPMHLSDTFEKKQIDELIVGYPTDQFPGRYEIIIEKGDLIVFNTRIQHACWGGGENRRQMAWMMRTHPRMDWEIERIISLNKSQGEQWSPETGRLISDQLFETAGPQRMKKIKLMKDLGL